MLDDAGLIAAATAVLQKNDKGRYTMPAGDLYPHQWLWDSCFIAIGLRHVDVERAKMEILSLLRGQWSNGMLPNMIFSDAKGFARDRNAWKSWLSPFAPRDVATSGITQPPLLAEAIVQVGKKMQLPERRQWYRQVYDALLEYHEWIYDDRDPHEEGLALLIHPWETGMDNTPPWMAQLHGHQLAWWIRAMQKSRLSNMVSLFRRDTRSVPANERFSNVEVLALFDIQMRLKRKAYDSDRILSHSMFAIEDLGFNSILVRANHHLKSIARTLGEEVPDSLLESMHHTEKALDELWHDVSNQYYSRDFITHNLILESSIATLLPLYAGTVSAERAKQLVKLIENEHNFGLSFPVPSVPKSSAWFDPNRYWQGPTWINTNWLIIDGLKRYGYNEHAALLRDLTLDLVRKSGCYEYFNPTTGDPLGADDFSWTAALAIDLLKS